MKDSTIHTNHLKKYAFVDQMGYIQKLDWMEMMDKRGYRQKKCPDCGLFTIWYKPKEGEKNNES